MTARDALFLLAMDGKPQSEDVQQAVTGAIDAHRAEVLARDGQAYDGQLAMAVGLIRVLRVVARDHDMTEVRRLLTQHVLDEQAARADNIKPPTPSFFQPGHVYARESHGRRVEFDVRLVDTGPGQSFPTAFGFRQVPESRAPLPYDCDDFTGWDDVTEDGAG
ncbi:hypothetical protein OHB14_36435 [Streptomyces sp. NBC_01613]|uniref:hypothetical protein n=1 Tax=Streptomyces sp. NBC_01613 TaxID=2975896 RepID=UPI00386D742C